MGSRYKFYPYLWAWWLCLSSSGLPWLRKDLVDRHRLPLQATTFWKQRNIDESRTGNKPGWQTSHLSHLRHFRPWLYMFVSMPANSRLRTAMHHSQCLPHSLCRGFIHHHQLKGAITPELAAPFYSASSPSPLFSKWHKRQESHWISPWPQACNLPHMLK